MPYKSKSETLFVTRITPNQIACAAIILSKLIFLFGNFCDSSPKIVAALISNGATLITLKISSNCASLLWIFNPHDNSAQFIEPITTSPFLHFANVAITSSGYSFIK